eukprot:GHVT01075478.1.p2 GENE.GHVT01075478.1~~GHVT01075478.1.p2  ORF type:complete len:162 (+),score=9.61 GHVT01075478.1:4002-4487(+)
MKVLIRSSSCVGLLGVDVSEGDTVETLREQVCAAIPCDPSTMRLARNGFPLDSFDAKLSPSGTGISLHDAGIKNETILDMSVQLRGGFIRAVWRHTYGGFYKPWIGFSYPSIPVALNVFGGWYLFGKPNHTYHINKPVEGVGKFAEAINENGDNLQNGSSH